MTVSQPGHLATDDPLASQRQEFADKLAAAQASLIQIVAKLAVALGDTSAGNAQLARLSALQASIGTASAADLAMMGSQVAAAVRQSEAIEREAGEQIAAITGNVVSASLQQAATASRTAVTSAMDCLRHTPLQFASAEDERAYREREEETRRYIAEQNAKGTPEGNLNAAGATVGQMVDAKAHGAHGPEFDQQWANLVATTEKLREQVRASGGSVAQFDQHLRDDIRRTLKGKGLTDAQIDAQFAAHNGDPLEAAKAFMQGKEDVNRISADVKKHREDAVLASAPSAEQAPPPPEPSPLSDAVSSLLAAGVSPAAPMTTDTQPEHGVTTRALPALAPSRSV